MTCSEAYTSKAEFANAVGLYLVAWGILTFIFFIASLRSSIALVSLFFCLDITFWCLVGAELGGSTKAAKAGGAFGIVSGQMSRQSIRADVDHDNS